MTFSLDEICSALRFGNAFRSTINMVTSEIKACDADVTKCLRDSDENQHSNKMQRIKILGLTIGHLMSPM